MASKIMYQDPGGNAVVGYLINGKTYKDAGGTQRVDVGSVVTTPDAKQWLMTETGGVQINGAGASPMAAAGQTPNPYQQLIDAQKEQNNAYAQQLAQMNAQYSAALKSQQSALEKQLQAQREANEQTTAANVARLEAQKPLVIEERNAAAQNAYIQNMQNMRRMPQVQKAMGTTGGLSESSLLASQANYENNQANIYQNAQNQLRDIDTAIAEARGTGAVTDAGLAADYYGQLAGLESDAAQQALSLQAQASQTALDLVRERADNLAQYGIFTGYGDLGYSAEDIAGMENAYRQLLAAQKTKASGSDSIYGNEDYEGLFEAAKASPNAANYIATYYKNFGFNKSTGLQAAYNEWLENSYLSEYELALTSAALNRMATGQATAQDVRDYLSIYDVDSLNVSTAEEEQALTNIRNGNDTQSDWDILAKHGITRTGTKGIYTY